MEASDRFVSLGTSKHCNQVHQQSVVHVVIVTLHVLIFMVW